MVGMKKPLIAQLLIIIFALAIILPLAFSILNPPTTSGTKGISNPFREGISLELKSGQTVTGSVTYGRDDTAFMILGSDGEELQSRYLLSLKSEQKTVTFQFIAPLSGTYVVAVGNNYGWLDNIDYSYTISPPPVLGFDPFALIAIVIAVAVVLTLINVSFYAIRRKNRIQIASDIIG
jgi:hypothetical protein